jgi:hypothetical protein
MRIENSATIDTTRRSEAARPIVPLILSCVPLASVVGGAIFAVTFANIRGYGDSTLMIASWGGFATGSLTSLGTFAWLRSRVNNSGSRLRDLRVSDIVCGVLTALVLSPVSLLLFVSALPLMATPAAGITAIAGEAIANIICLAIPAAAFFAVGLSGMQWSLETSLIARGKQNHQGVELANRT